MFITKYHIGHKIGRELLGWEIFQMRSARTYRPVNPEESRTFYHYALKRNGSQWKFQPGAGWLPLVCAILMLSKPVNQHERHRSTVLNVTKEATQAEVHDRYRSLSLVFHPDKQIDEQLKATATKEFLKIQKAYQG